MKRIALLAALALSTVAHAQVKISELPAAATLTGAEIVPVVQSGTTVRTTNDLLSTFMMSTFEGRANVWNGVNVFNQSTQFDFSGTPAASTVELSANIPQLEWHVANGNANTRRWMAWANVTNMHYALCNDAGNSCNDYLTVVHDGVGTPTGVTIMPPLTTTKGIVDTFASVALQPSILTMSITPQIELNQSNGVANQRRWNFAASNGFAFRMLNDAGTTASNVWGVGPNANEINTFIPALYSFVSTPAAYSITAQSANPQIGLWNTGLAADMKRWDWVTSGTNSMNFRSCNDAGNNCGSFFSVTRGAGAAIASMSIGHTNATITTHVGQSVFTAPSTTSAPTVTIANTNPQLEIQYNSGATDAKRWNWLGAANALQEKVCNDAGTTCNTYFAVNRSTTTVSGINFYTGATPATNRFAIDVNGVYFVNGSAGTAGQVLTSAGPTTAPTWTTPTTGGPVMRAQREPIPNTTAGGFAAVTVTWTTPFADANYTLTCTANTAAGAVQSLTVDHTGSIGASAFVANVRNGGATSASGTLHCIAIHD